MSKESAEQISFRATFEHSEVSGSVSKSFALFADDLKKNGTLRMYDSWLLSLKSLIRNPHAPNKVKSDWLKNVHALEMTPETKELLHYIGVDDPATFLNQVGLMTPQTICDPELLQNACSYLDMLVRKDVRQRKVATEIRAILNKRMEINV